MPGAREAIRLLNDSGYWVFVVTNQSGVARGYYDEASIRTLHDWVQAQLAEVGAHVDAFYYCPHGPDSECDCRKPRPGMLRQAMADFPVDPARSVLVGDKSSDVEAAEAAGIRGIRYVGGDVADLVRGLLRDESNASEVF